MNKKYDFRKVKITKEYNPGIPGTLCVKTKIQQVFLNLMKNSTQAMWDAKIKNPQLILRVFREENLVCIEIEDNGPGMDEATRKRVFEPFYTTKPVGFGTGLGLSVSYFIIVDDHGGKMTVESFPGQGAKFLIGLACGRIH